MAPGPRPQRSTPSTARRRRPRRGDVTEKAILDGAERLLAERPLSAIGIEELAAGAGISRPSFYFYFGSREAVLRALAERIAEDLYRASEVWLRRSGESPAEALRRAIAAILTLWRAHGPVLRAVVRSREADPEIGGFWEAVGRRFIDAAAEQIERERAAGLAPPGPTPRSLAAVLLSMNERAFYDASLGRGSAAQDRDLVETLATVWQRAVYGGDAAEG